MLHQIDVGELVRVHRVIIIRPETIRPRMALPWDGSSWSSLTCELGTVLLCNTLTVVRLCVTQHVSAVMR